MYREHSAHARAFFMANPGRRYYGKFSDVEGEHNPILLVYSNPGRIGEVLDPFVLSWCPQGGERSCLAVEDWLNTSPQAEDFLDGIIARPG